jgi:hypothetical protein
MKILEGLKAIDLLPEPKNEFKAFMFKKAIDALFFVFPVKKIVVWMRFTMYPDIIGSMQEGLSPKENPDMALRPDEEYPVYIIRFLPSPSGPGLYGIKAVKKRGTDVYRMVDSVNPQEAVNGFYTFFHERETISADLAKFITLYQDGAIKDQPANV